mmetsp:Transcript_10508/g.38675  ORF Transcript_10508/g.38675 Transcript_10508/m.38675 type:complete len:226 (+) Transcript_10508:52-729(+)
MAPSPLGLYDTSAEEQEDERRHVLVPPVVGDSPHLDAVDTGARHYPRCLVWCNLGLLTCFFPLVGHCGISTSKGVITDFAGPYFIHTSKHSLAFGSPVKYLQLDLGKVPGGLERYDSVVEQGASHFRQRPHNVFTNNCHSHVAHVLNKLEYGGHANWNIVDVVALIVFRGSFSGTVARLWNWGLFVIALPLASLILGWMVAVVWLGIFALLVGYFLVATYVLHIT